MSRNENLTISVEKSIKILHFSDGVMEVFEDDHNVNESHKEESVDEKKMKWSPWLIHKISQLGKKVLNVLDDAGDTLGITSPKYSYEINQYKKQLAIKAQEKNLEEENTWKIHNETEAPITKQFQKLSQTPQA